MTGLKLIGSAALATISYLFAYKNTFFSISFVGNSFFFLSEKVHCIFQSETPSGYSRFKLRLLHKFRSFH